jgi:L-lactate dehydrogenase complex protein LldE
MRPAVGFAAVRLLQDAGCAVSVPAAQTCCGQPAYNSGDPTDARAIARAAIEAFEEFDYVVAPSGSCAGMLRLHYPELFKNDPAWKARAENLAARAHELLSFLVDVMRYEPGDVSLIARATYHDGCSGLRELGVKKQPRALLARVKNLDVIEAAEAETCCGFGGLFCVKYPDVSTHIVDAKIDDAVKTGAALLLGGDLGCLLNIEGRLRRRGIDMKVRHAAEVLAAMPESKGGSV